MSLKNVNWKTYFVGVFTGLLAMPMLSKTFEIVSNVSFKDKCEFVVDDRTLSHIKSYEEDYDRIRREHPGIYLLNEAFGDGYPIGQTSNGLTHETRTKDCECTFDLEKIKPANEGDTILVRQTLFGQKLDIIEPQ